MLPQASDQSHYSLVNPVWTELRKWGKSVMKHMDLKYGHDHIPYFSLNCCRWFGTRIWSDYRVMNLPKMEKNSFWPPASNGLVTPPVGRALWFTVVYGNMYMTLPHGQSAWFPGIPSWFVRGKLRPCAWLVATRCVSCRICRSSVYCDCAAIFV